MAPTIQTGRRDDRDRERRQRPGEKRSDLVCRVKYNNTLPDIPFDPKFITYPFESNRFYTYKATSLESAFKYDLLTEHDLGVTIDLINPNTYKVDPNAFPEREDEKLLEEDLNAPGDAKRSRHHNTNVSWLRKTEYISTEYNRFIQKNVNSESQVGFKIKQIMKDEDIYKDRESQIKSIDETFEKAKLPIEKHFSKPGVTAVQVNGVFPDFDLWKYPFAQVMFDSDPASQGDSSAAVQVEELSQAMIRGAVDESGDQFVAYFLPTEDTLGKRKRDFVNEKEYEEGESYEYLLAREYNWNVKNKLSKGYEETYFFTFREDGVYYNELETRVRLSKRRKTVSSGLAKSRLVVQHRELAEKEISAQNNRCQMLEPPGEEEEEEEEPMPDLTAEVENGEREDNDGNKSDAGSEREGRRPPPRRRKIDSDDDEDDKASVKSGAGSDRSKSGSRSRSRSKSRSASRSHSRSKSGSKSRSRSRSKSGSRSKSRTPSRSRSRSRSKSGSRSVSRSRSRSGSKSVSRSRSRSASRSKSRSASRSRSRSGGSRSRSRSRSKSGSRSGSGRSRSRSKSKSGSDKSGSESEGEERPKDKGKDDEEEIFGSANSSDDSD